MTSSNNGGLRLKQQRGWFVAGDGFRRGLARLSDGGFRLFALMCLEADRHSGRIEVTQKRLAQLLSRSKRSVGVYVAELEAKGVCRVEAGKNQYAPSWFEISDDYWPYHRSGSCGVRGRQSTAPLVRSPPIESGASVQAVNGPEPTGGNSQRSRAIGKSEVVTGVGLAGEGEAKDYVETVREWFVRLGCGKGSFSAGDERFACELERRGVELRTVEKALLLGGVRKYMSWLDGGDRSPIGSLRYFDGVISEIEELPPVGEDYWRYLGGKIKQLAAMWRELVDGGEDGLARSQRGIEARSKGSVVGGASVGGAKR